MSTNALKDSIRDRREIGVKRENRITNVTKNADGSMSLIYGDGRTGTLSAQDEMLQVFAIFTVLDA